MNLFKAIVATLAVFSVSTALQAAPLGSAFTYQGTLAQSGVDVNDNCDFQFGLWDASGGGSEVAMAIDVPNMSVVDGKFTVELDFGGGAFAGDARWLQIAVACPAGGGLTTLAPRQELTPSPNALFAASAGAMDWSGLSGVPAGLDDGDNVDDADADPANELQDLDLSVNTLSLSGDASPVDLSGYLDNTDDQTLAEVLAQGNDAGGTSVSNIGTTTTNALIISGLDCTANVNGGALTTDGAEVYCSDDDAGGGGGNTLDQAYDQGGAGAGRTITADSGDVTIDGPDGLTLDAGSLLQLAGDPMQVGSLGIGLNPTDVFVSGRYAYVVDGDSNDLKVIDVSDSTTPSVAGSLTVGTFPAALYVSGRYAFIVDQDVGDLKVIDVSDPGAPTLAGSLEIGAVPTSVYVAGRYAYVVDADSHDLRVIDVSDPGAPSQVGDLGIGMAPYSVYVSGRYAYVVDQLTDDLKVIDVSDPATPSLAGSLPVGSIPLSVYVSGRYAYVIDSGSDDLKVIDVSDPTALGVVGNLGVGAGPADVFVSGRYAYVTDTSSDDLKVIDVSDPTMPVLAGSLGVGAFPLSLYVSGRYAYIVDLNADDLKVIDVSGAEVNGLIAHSLEAGNLQVRNDVIAQGQLQVTGGASLGSGGLFSDGDVGVAGAMTIHGLDGLTLDSTSLFQSPGDPVEVGSLGIGSAPTSLYVSGRYAYVTDGLSTDLKVIDVSNPNAPSLVGSLGGISQTGIIHVSGRYAYVPDANFLKVIDVSDPSAPVEVGSLNLGGLPGRLAASGRYVYSVDSMSDELKVIDVSDPTGPSLAGSVAIGAFPVGVRVVGRYAYVADFTDANLTVIDVADPATPSVVGTLSVGGTPRSIDVSGGYAYIADNTSQKLIIVDVSDPGTPALAGSIMLGAPGLVRVSGRYAYVTNFFSNDLDVVDVSDPAMPVVEGTLAVGGGVGALQVSGRYAYVLDADSDELKILDITGAEVSSLTAHALEAGNLQVRQDVFAQGQLQVTSGITVGAGGIFSDGNIGVSGTVAIANDIVPTASPANMVQLYAEDVAGSSELKVRDEAGNVTPLSPHNFSLIGKPSEPMAWSFYSENALGKINVDMLRAMRLIEWLTGEKLVYTEIKVSANGEISEPADDAITGPAQSLLDSVSELMRQNEELRADNEALARRVEALEQGAD